MPKKNLMQHLEMAFDFSLLLSNIETFCNFLATAKDFYLRTAVEITSFAVEDRQNKWRLLYLHEQISNDIEWTICVMTKYYRLYWLKHDYNSFIYVCI